MAKKKTKSQISSIAPFLSALLGIAAIVMIFLPAIGIKDSDTTYTGIQVVFGYTAKTMLGDVVHLNFSFMNLLTYILVAGGVVFTVLGMLGKGSKFASFISAVAFIVAGVFFFLTVSYCVPNEGLENIIKGLGSLLGQSSSIKDSLTLAAGSIIGGILSILAGLCSLAKVLLK